MYMQFDMIALPFESFKAHGKFWNHVKAALVEGYRNQVSNSTLRHKKGGGNLKIFFLLDHPESCILVNSTRDVFDPAQMACQGPLKKSR